MAPKLERKLAQWFTENMIKHKGTTIEWGVETGTPSTPKKQKELRTFRKIPQTKADREFIEGLTRHRPEKESGTPLTLKKQKGPLMFIVDDPGPFPTKRQQRILARRAERIARASVEEGRHPPQCGRFPTLYQQRPFLHKEDDDATTTRH